jgi:di/tricarboxylate transporter
MLDAGVSMTFPGQVTLVVLVGALALFLWGRFRSDVVGLMVMTTLLLTGVLTPAEGLSGFSNEALLTVAAMFVLSSGLVRTGAVDLLGRWIARAGRGSELRLLAVTFALVIPLSAFLNNTPVVAVMVPMVIGLSRTTGVRASRFLMPISFVSQMGGTLTLIGTSTNLLVAGVMIELGLERIGLFDVTPPALVLTALGVLYLLTFGRRLTPDRRVSSDLLERYELGEYITVLELEVGSPLADRTLGESRFGSRFGLEVVALERDGERIHRPDATTVVRPGDLIMAMGTAADIARVEEAARVRIRRGQHATATMGGRSGHAPVGDVRLAELLVPPRSPVEGRTLEALRFRARYGVPVLGIRRQGETLHQRVKEVELRPGDLLLVQGTTEELLALQQERDLTLIGVLQPPARRERKLKIAVPILAGVVALAAFDVLPILLAALLGVVAMFVTGCVTPEEAYHDTDWMVLVLLGSILPLGLALQKTGVAEVLAGGVMRTSEPFGLYGTLAAFYLLTSLLTEVISNNATAVVVTPIAVATAQSLGVSHLPFVMAVMIAASNSFMTPIGYQTNTFVYGPGGYRFGDFIRVGGPLNLLLLIAASVVIPWFFPFTP